MLTRLPLAALFACALLVLAELCTRAFFKPPYVSLDTYTSYYPGAYLYGTDGSRACFRVRQDMSCAPTRDMRLIPQTFPLKKPPGELRIIVIGASISWEGPHPSKSVDNYPSQMLASLQRAHPRSSLRLINLSVPGFGSSRQLVRFREALEYDPDLLIIHTSDINEDREDKRRAYVRELHSGLAGSLLSLNSVVVLKEWWANTLPPFTRERAVAVGSEEAGDTTHAARSERWAEGLKRCAGLMLDAAKARSIPVILVAASRGDNKALMSGVGRDYNDFMREHARGNVQFLDVPTLFRDAIERKPRRVFKDGIHYNGEGIRLVAETLTPMVETALPALAH